MPTISLCMIVKNEEEVLARCLQSVVSLVDEVIIVDTGSEDSTVEIAKRFTTKVYHFPWIDDFAAARNFSFSKATKDYCMWIDADDIIEDTQKDSFSNLVASLDASVEIVMMKYNTAFDSDGAPVFSYYRERLIRNNGLHIWSGQVHEAIVPAGIVVYSEIAISHKKVKPGDPKRNINIYRKMLEEGKELESRHLYYYARELYYHKEYETATDTFLRFLERTDGWKENKIEACSIASYCYEKRGMEHEAIQILFQSFQYDIPRAEICCDIGKIFFEKKLYHLSAYWYELALTSDKKNRRSGFILPDCYDYLPSIQLAVCYDRLGDKKKAIEYNEKAGMVKPNAKSYLWNKAYFSNFSQIDEDSRLQN